MLSKLFDNIRPGTGIFLVIFGVLWGVVSVFISPSVAQTFHFIGYEMQISAGAGGWIAIPLTAILALLINFIIVERGGLLKRHYYLSLMWIMLVWIIYPSGPTLDVLFQTSIIAVFLLLLLDLHHVKRYRERLLDLGLLVGVMMLQDPAMSFMLLLLWITLIIYAKFDLRNMSIALFGIALVLWLVGIAMFVLGAFDNYLLLWDRLIHREYIITTWDYAIIGLMGFWMLPALMEYFSALARAKILKRQGLSTMMMLLLVLLIPMALGTIEWQHALSLSAFPLSILAVNFQQYRNKTWQKELLPWSMVIFAIIRWSMI